MRTKRPSSGKSKNKEQQLWLPFNFLERLLVFCSTPGRKAPKESGVEFRISIPEEEKSLCVLFKIDQNPNPLFESHEKRPDYLALYTNMEGCILTIIEMKGRSAEETKRGVQQIRGLRDKLARELATHMPGAFVSRTTIQGILLTPPNAQVPSPMLERQAKEGIVILPLRLPAQRRTACLRFSGKSAYSSWSHQYCQARQGSRIFTN